MKEIQRQAVFGDPDRIIVDGGNRSDSVPAETRTSPCTLGHYDSMAGWRRNSHEKRGARRQ